MNTLGNKLKVTVFGQSHAPAIGCVIDGLPAGFEPDMERVAAFMARRAPGQNAWSTPRKESTRRRFSPDWWTVAPAARQWLW